MLLEYFLSSTRSDTSMDTKSLLNNTPQVATAFPDVNAEQFKNTLNNTIESRQKYHIKQGDTPFSESELLHAVQQWDKLYSNADNASNTKSIDNKNQFLETGEAASLAIAAKHQRFHAAHNVGDIVPADGKTLPDNVATSQKSNDAISSDGTKIIPTVNNSLLQQSSNTQAEGQVKEQAITQKTAKPSIESQLQTNIPNKEIPNKEGVDSQTAEKKTIDSKNETVLPKNKPLITEGMTSKQSLEAAKAKEINVANNAKVDKSIPNTVNTQKNINIQPVITDAKVDDKSVAANKSELITNLLAGTKKITAEPIKHKAEQSSNTNTSNHSLKGLTGLVDAIDKLTNIIANKEQNKSVISADNAILKSANIPVEVTKSKQTEGIGSKELISTELENRFSDKSPSLKPSSTNDALLQSARRDDAAASLLQSSASTSTSYDSSTGSGVKPLHVSVMDPTSVHNPQNNTQNINKLAETPLSVEVSADKWKQKFAQHVSMLALNGNTNAQIKLDPPELGPMAIRINHTGSETQVQFMVNNAVAKELVDSGTQRLREMLEEHGFENVNVDVNEFSKEQQNLSDSEAFEQDIDDKSEEMQSNSNSNSEKTKSETLIDLYI